MRKKGKYFIEQKRNISKSFPFADGAKVEFTMTDKSKSLILFFFPY